jgi:hypothetical protein
MWHRTLFLLTVGGLSLTTLGTGQSLPFRVGEHLQYTAQFNIIPAGSASLRVMALDTVNANPTFHVRFEARTGSLADRIYKIRDRIDTWLDKTGLYTHKQSKRLREGSYRKQWHLTVDYDRSIAVTNGDTVAISHPVRDPYSLFYYLRTIPLTSGTTIPLTTYENQTLTEFYVQVTGKETVLVPAGTFPSLVVKPFREGKALFKNQGDMQIWFSDDARRLPVQIQIKLKYGSMLLRLKSFSL